MGEDLRAENEKLWAENAALRQRVAELEKHIAELEATLSKAKRQATPFARQKRVSEPRRPGRKKGRGRFSYRRKPAPEEVSETKRAPLGCCPRCGGELIERKEHEQFVVDDTVYPCWVNLAIGGRISTLMAPTILAQGLLRQSDVEIVGKETVAGRDTLQIVAQLPDGNTDLFWIDLATGVILREELYTGDQIRFSLIVDSIQFDPPIPDGDQLFSVEPVE